MRALTLMSCLAVFVACAPERRPGPTPTPTSDAAVVSADGLAIDDGFISPDGASSGEETTPGTDVPSPLGDGAQEADAQGSCMSNEDFFQTELWAPVFSVTCVGCHNPSGLAQATDLVFDITDTPESFAHNQSVAESIALKDFQGVPVLLLKPSAQHPEGHAGGEVAPAGSTAYAAMDAWVKRVQSGDPCVDTDSQAQSCEAVVPGPPMLRLLNRSEYDRTIEDLFGFDSTWGAGFTPENVLHGFDNQAEALVVPPLLAEQFRDAAEAIAAQAVTDMETILPCDPEADGEEACRDAFVAGFGARAFRRPLSQGEQERYILLHSVTAVDDGFAGAIEVVVTAMLQSPHFLYRRELGVAQEDGTYALTPHEVASFLSYFLWGSMPDQELFDRADDGSLVGADVLAEQAERLLEDPRSAATIERFALQWLGVDRLAHIPKDPLTYPTFTDQTREAMTHQSLGRIQQVMGDEEGTLLDLLIGQEVIIDGDLAAFYGLPGPGSAADESGFGPVDTSESPYGGLLTDGGVLATHAFSNGSSPIHRGLFVREQLLCQELPLPPPGIVAEPPAMDPEATTRERFTAHAELEECAGCHRLMDPIGFALEHFDGVGRYREDENGLPIDATGEIVGTGYTNGTFDGPEELANLLGESPETRRCFAQQWLRYAYGMEVTAGMKCLLDHIADSFQDNDLRVRALLRALATSAHATTRADAVLVELEPEPPPVVTPQTGDGEADAGSGSSPDTSGDEPGPTPGEVSTDVSVESSWGAGHCDQVTVTNEGGSSVTWSVSLDVNGVLTQVWEATHVPGDDGETVFSGATWNHTLAPGQSTSFGYCADTTLAEVMAPGGGGGASPDDLEITIEPYTEWGTGYCANGSVTNVGAGVTTWGFSWPVDGEIYNVWEATATPMGDQVYFTGVASNATLAPGEAAAFGFCANL